MAAIQLREAAADARAENKLPAIAAGDFNFDYNFVERKGNPAFDAFCEGEICKCFELDELVDTNWSDPDDEGADNDPDSILDFAFVAGDAKSLDALLSETGARDTEPSVFTPFHCKPYWS